MVSSKLVDWQRVTFDEAFTDITAKANKVDQSEFLHSGKYPIVDQGQNFIAGYADNEELVWGDDLPVVIFGDHTRILKYIDFPFVLGADGTKVLKPNKEILPLFAYYQLLSFDIPSAGYSRHFKFLKDFSFQYPPLTEQKRIASLLARADRLRTLRRTAHELGDALLQSVFLEMFGDLAVNSKNWEKIELGDALDVITYGLTVRPEYIEKGIPLISAREIRSGVVEFGDAPRISEKDFSETYDKGKPQKGDILFSKTGTIGSCAEVTTDEIFAITQNVARLHFKDKLANNSFAIQYLRTPFFQEMAKDAGKGNAVQDLQLGVMQQFPFYLPPLSLQEEFAGVVARVESLRGRMSEAERQVEGLFESLLSESFGA